MTQSVTGEQVDRKTGRPGDVRDPAHEFVDRGGERRFVVRSHDLVRTVLRLSEGTRQAGFNAEMVRSSTLYRWPMLYTEGPEHREQRRLAAQFFTPKAVTRKHRQMIETVSDELVSELERSGGGRLDVVSFRLAMRVVCEVIGLTHSDQRAMERLLDDFFRVPPPPEAPRWRHLARAVADQVSTVRFHLVHVRPAVRAHRRESRDDVLSSLLEQGLRERDILIECLTYAAAGMVTTRQFIAVAVWHLIDRPELRRRFVAGDDGGRRAVLHELIRLETVAGNLLRRTTCPVTLETGDGPVTLPEGTLIDLEMRAANADESAFGDHALALDPDRCPVTGRPGGRVASQGLSFGDGPHGCPGEFLALEETDIFLRRFFRTDWSIESVPSIDWNDVVLAYDIQDLVVRPTPQP